MKAIYLKFLLFLTPFLLVLIWGELKVYQSGETVPFKKVIDAQLSSEDELYYYRALLNNNMNAYKVEMINRQKPEIITLGQSVVLNFRDFMFHPMEDKFYNGGHLVNNIWDIQHVVELWKSNKLHRPKMVIFGLDAGIPKKNNYLDFFRNFRIGYSDKAYDLNAHMHALQNIYKNELFKVKKIPKGDPKLGFGYFGQLGNGYRKDGSFHMLKRTSEFLKDPVFTDDRNAIDLFDKHLPPFSGEWEIDPKKIPMLLGAFKEMKAMDMEVIIHLSPYSAYFFDHCLTNDEFLIFWEQFLDLKQQIVDAGYPVFQWGKSTDLGFDDRFFQDAFHPGETIIGLQFYDFLRKGAGGSKLLQKVDKNHLLKIIKSPKTHSLSFQIESPILQQYMDTIPKHDSLFSAMKMVDSFLENGLPKMNYKTVIPEIR